jgi:UPF0716 protein FxsA
VRFFLLALVLFVTWSYTEVTLMLLVANRVGILYALLLTIGTGAAGIAVARAQGWRLLLHLRNELQRGGWPVESLFDGALLFVAGILLLIPGFLSDGLGLLLLLPWFRGLVAVAVRAWWRRRRRQRSTVTVLEGKVLDSPDGPHGDGPHGDGPHGDGPHGDGPHGAAPNDDEGPAGP